MLKTKKINNEKIDVIKTPQAKPNEILGWSIIPQLHANIFICARKGEGKTNVAKKIIFSCANKRTKIIVFASTHDLDDNWKVIKKELEKEKINAVYYSGLVEDGVDNLEEVMKFMKAEAEAENQLKEQNTNDFIQIIKVDEKKGIKLKLKKPKKESPKYMIIFDDISIDLKKRNVPFLLKTFRHYKAKVIVSTQWPNDLTPDSRKQMDFFLLFRGHSEEKMEELYNDMGVNLTFEELWKVYKEVTTEQYNFLYVNRNTGELRKNFSEEIILS